MNLWSIIPLIASAAFVVLFIVVSSQAKRQAGRILSLYIITSGLWSFAAFMLTYDTGATTDYLKLWQSLVVTAIPLVAVTYYYFVRVYNNKTPGRGVYIGYAITGLILVLGLSGNIVKETHFNNDYLDYDIGAWAYLVPAILLPFIAIATRSLILRYRHSIDPTDRNRTMFLLLGASLLILLTYINSVIPALAGYPTEHIGSIGNAIIITYAISRLHLLDIKFVARRFLTYFALFGILIGVYFGTMLIGLSIFGNDAAGTIIGVSTILVIILALLTRPLIATIEEIIDRLFYRDTYHYRQSLLSFSTKMGNILDLDKLAQEMLPALTKALSITHATLLFQDKSDADFVVQYVHPEGENESLSKLKLSTDSPIIHWLNKNNKALNPEHIESIPEFKGLWQVEKEQLHNSDLGLLHPIKSHGKLIGIMALGTKHNGNIFANDDLALITGISNQAGIIIENAQLYTHATNRAITDGLTGLYNHRHFHERIDQEIARASRFGTTFSLVLLDLDLFKSYNDIYGHLAGDQLLNKIGYLLQSAVRGIDMAFRYGGEEFALILPETPIDDAYQVAERIRKSIEANSSFREMPVTASVGIGSWPNDGIMKEEIINHADSALYHSKQTGRNRTSLSSDVLKLDKKAIGTELESQPKSLSVIYALAATVDAKDNYTYGHSRKVSEYAVALAEKLRLPKEKIETIRAAGLLHDIGKIGVPDSTLAKPGTLDDDEWKIVKTHPELGVEILKRVKELVSCLPPILHHHEHFNGSGYPKGLSGNNIPLEARILSIADAYDAITSPRPYRGQLSMAEAIEELMRCSGNQFDPELVKLFAEVVEPLTKKGKRLPSDSDSKKE